MFRIQVQDPANERRDAIDHLLELEALKQQRYPSLSIGIQLPWAHRRARGSIRARATTGNDILHVRASRRLAYQFQPLIQREHSKLLTFPPFIRRP